MEDNIFLSKNYWDERWQKDDTGWDIGYVSPPLKAFIDQYPDKQSRVLIPGAGSSYEATYLVQQGFTAVTVIDISPSAIEKAKQIAGNDSSIEFICGNFFELKNEYDLIIEQTFFCALDPSLRPDYVKQMHHLLSPAGMLAGVLFGIIFDAPGPPFGATKEQYQQFFEPLFHIRKLELCYNSIERRQGNELFVMLNKR